MSLSIDPRLDSPTETLAVDSDLSFRRLQDQRDKILSMLELARAEEFTRATVWPQIRGELLSHQRLQVDRAVRTFSEDAELQSLVASHEARAERIDLLIGQLDRCDIISEGWAQLVDALLTACTSQFSTELPDVYDVWFATAQPESAQDGSYYEELSFEDPRDLDDLSVDESPSPKPGIVASALRWFRAHPGFEVSVLFGIGIVVGLIRRRHPAKVHFGT